MVILPSNDNFCGNSRHHLVSFEIGFVEHTRFRGECMEILLSNEAMDWFRNEMEVEDGDYIRFYARYGGSSPFHEGFSLGMNREIPHEMGVHVIVEGVHFYIEKADAWFFNEHHLIVQVDKNLDELSYSYKKA